MSPRSLKWRIYTNIFSRFGETFVIKNKIKKKESTKRPELFAQMLTSLVVAGKSVFRWAAFH